MRRVAFSSPSHACVPAHCQNARRSDHGAHIMARAGAHERCSSLIASRHGSCVRVADADHWIAVPVVGGVQPIAVFLNLSLESAQLAQTLSSRFCHGRRRRDLRLGRIRQYCQAYANASGCAEQDSFEGCAMCCVHDHVRPRLLWPRPAAHPSGIVLDATLDKCATARACAITRAGISEPLRDAAY